MKPAHAGRAVGPGAANADSAEVSILASGAVEIEGWLAGADAGQKLEARFRSLHEAALLVALESFTVDVRRLAWVSDLALSAFVTWVMWIEREPASKRYRVKFTIDHRSAWQSAVFQTLRSIAPDVVEIDARRAHPERI